MQRENKFIVTIKLFKDDINEAIYVHIRKRYPDMEERTLSAPEFEVSTDGKTLIGCFVLSEDAGNIR